MFNNPSYDGHSFLIESMVLSSSSSSSCGSRKHKCIYCIFTFLRAAQWSFNVYCSNSVNALMTTVPMPNELRIIFLVAPLGDPTSFVFSLELAGEGD